MTAVKTVSVRRRFRPHLEAPHAADAARFDAMVQLLHGGWRGWAAALRGLAGRG
jgi:hypothetical protein